MAGKLSSQVPYAETRMLTSRSFLWIRVALDSIIKDIVDWDLPNQILQKLELQPLDLSDLYANMFAKIQPKYHYLARQMFQWLLYSIRPLSVKELVEAAKLNPEPVFYQSSIQQQTSYLGKFCGHMVSIQGGNDNRQVLLLHFSCREFLLQYKSIPDLIPSTTEAQLNIVNRSLECLLANNQSMISEKGLESSPFLQYSAQYWPVHLKKCTTEIPDNIISNLNKLFDHKAPQCFLNWLRIFDPAHPENGTLFDATLDQFGDQAFYVSLLNVPLDVVTSSSTLPLRVK